MSLAEFMTYVQTYFIKLFADVVVKFLVNAAEHYLLTAKKGIISDQMSGLANNFKIECPRCKHIGGWEPAPDDDQLQELPEEKKNKQLTM
jgi:hypothetical protein